MAGSVTHCTSWRDALPLRVDLLDGEVTELGDINMALYACIQKWARHDPSPSKRTYCNDDLATREVSKEVAVGELVLRPEQGRELILIGRNRAVE
jgi:hypothetical protein